MHSNANFRTLFHNKCSFYDTVLVCVKIKKEKKTKRNINIKNVWMLKSNFQLSGKQKFVKNTEKC